MKHARPLPFSFFWPPDCARRSARQNWQTSTGRLRHAFIHCLHHRPMGPGATSYAVARCSKQLHFVRLKRQFIRKNYGCFQASRMDLRMTEIRAQSCRAKPLRTSKRRVQEVLENKTGPDQETDLWDYQRRDHGATTTSSIQSSLRSLRRKNRAAVWGGGGGGGSFPESQDFGELPFRHQKTLLFRCQSGLVGQPGGDRIPVFQLPAAFGREAAGLSPSRTQRSVTSRAEFCPTTNLSGPSRASPYRCVSM